jgi:hypothetical protein
MTTPVEPSITCPQCLMTSYNPTDIREGYCGNCHDWTTDRPVNPLPPPSPSLDISDRWYPR